jgi:hypothetical protein
LTQAEEDEDLTLLIAMVEEIKDAPTSLLTVRSALVEQQQVHLDETKVQAFLGTTSSADGRLEGRYLNTGARNHMTGHDEVFFDSEIDQVVQGTVKFGDGSVVNICGKGTVIFSGRRGEHKVLTDVYWIPRPRNSIISVGQMDEGSSCVLIEGGVLKIWDRQRRLLARVQRTENQMHRLEVQVVRPLGLTVHQNDEAWWWHERLG